LLAARADHFWTHYSKLALTWWQQSPEKEKWQWPFCGGKNQRGSGKYQKGSGKTSKCSQPSFITPSEQAMVGVQRINMDKIIRRCKETLGVFY
jgi:hypothetical protein